MKRILAALLALASSYVVAQAQQTVPMPVGMFCLNAGGTAWVPSGGVAGACGGGGGGGSGGLSVQDGAAFTAGTSNFTPGGGTYNVSIPPLTTGSQGTFALTAQRSLHVLDDNSQVIASATGPNGGLAVPDRSAFTFGTSNFSPIGGQYAVSITALTDGQTGAAALTSQRSLHTLDDNSSSLLTAAQAIQTNTGNPIPTQAVTVPIGGTGVTDGTNVASVKAASTAPASTDKSLVVALNPNAASVTDGTNKAAVKPASTAAIATDPALVVALSPNNPVTTGTSATNPTSTLTLTSTTSAYSAGNLVASSATAGSVVVPSFSIPATDIGLVPRLRLTSNDSTSTGWGGVTVRVDLWSAAPTFTNGDRGAYSPATGTAGHLGAFTCTFSSVYGDGVYSECTPANGIYAVLKLGSTSVFWSLTAVTATGVTGASKVFTLTAEVLG